jgi:hypothetical protein
MAIRNAWPKNKLLASFINATHPDGASAVIVKAIWEQFTGAENRL